MSGSSNTAGLVWTLSDIADSGKSEMVAITGSTYEIIQYISSYTRQERNSEDYTHFFEVCQHGRTRTSVDTIRHRGERYITDGCHYRKYYEKTQYLSFQHHCNGSTLIFNANELNGSGVKIVDMGYVSTMYFR